MYKLIMQLKDVDEYTKREVLHFIERKLDEVAKIRGQIAKDLRRLGGEYAFMHERYYHQLKEKYLRAHQSKKKLLILAVQQVIVRY